ncbi:MAG: hypothetical protein CME69_06870 [Halobacteriovorax sp.]|nr:hypothetical protein [Halobacteriovorax sp.]
MTLHKINDLGVGTWHLNAKDNEINLSKVACNILEYSQKEKFSIDDFKNIVDDTSKEKIRGHLVDLFENEIPFSTELLIRINKKKKWVIMSGQTIKVPQSNQLLCVGTIKEWTYSNVMKEELDIIRADVGSEVLHEVMGPMTIIRNSCSMINKFLKNKEFQKIEDESNHIGAATKRVMDIFSSMRDVIRNEIHLSDVNLLSVLKKVHFFLHDDFIENEVSYSTNIKTNHLDIKAVEGELIQALTIFVNNAIEANLDNDEKWVSIELDETENNVLIKVSDSGEGIPKEIQDKIFEKHFTTKGDRGGTGIGLDVCFKLLERIGGTIEIDNSAFNTTFLIYLPK